MDLTALAQPHAELRRLAIAGAALSTGDPRLKRHASLLAQHGPQVLARLGARLNALAQATEEASPAALLSCSTLLGAVRSTQLTPAPTGALAPLPAQAEGTRSQRRSNRLLATLRAALCQSGPGRAGQLKMAPEALFDLRVAHLLPAALDDAGIADVVWEAMEPVMESQAGLLDEVEASFSGRPAGDVRRLQILTAADPARAHRAARRLLEERPKPAVRAEIYRTLASDPEALPLLTEGARRGPVEARAAALSALPIDEDPALLSLILKCSEKGAAELRRAAFSALARRQEPEAAQAIAAQVGKEGNDDSSPYPTSLELLREALPHGQPALLSQLIAGLQDRTRPTGEGEGLRGPDRAERWRRWHFALALSWCPPTAESLSALCAACEEGWPPGSAFEFVFRHAEQSCVEALLSATARAHRKARSDERREDELVIAICRLPPARVFELLSEGAGTDKGLLSMMQGWRRRRAQPALPPGPLGAYYAALEWDPRWLVRSLDQERVMYTAALAEPNTPSAPAAARLCVDKLPKLNTERAILVLGCLERLGAPELGAQALAAIERHLKAAKKKIYYDHELQQLLNFLGPAQAEGLAKLRPLSKFPEHEGPIDSRLQQL